MPPHSKMHLRQPPRPPQLMFIFTTQSSRSNYLPSSVDRTHNDYYPFAFSDLFREFPLNSHLPARLPMPCIRQDKRRSPGRPRLETIAQTHLRKPARLSGRQKRGSASSEGSDSDSDSGGLRSVSDRDLESDFADLDSDGDLEPDFADIDLQSDSTTDPTCDVISLGFDRDLRGT